MFPLSYVIGVRAYQGGTRDAHGNPVGSWAAPVERSVYGYGPRTDSTEPGGTQVIVGLEVYAPPGFALTARDRVLVDGTEYEVVGEVGDWCNGPFGFEPGVTFDLERVEGGR